MFARLVGISLGLIFGVFANAAHAEYVYWSGSGFGSGIVRRADYSGANEEEVLRTPSVGGGGLALDSGYLFVASINNSQPSIVKAQIDGTEPTPILTGFPSIYGISVDPVNDRLYFHDNSQKRFMSLAEDGSDLQPSIVTGSFGAVESIAVDSVHRMLYWTQIGSLWRAPLDGGAIEQIAVPDEALELIVRSVAIDPIADQVYWTEWHSDDTHEPVAAGRLRRANLDGSDAHTILHALDPRVETEGVYIGAFNPSYLAIDPLAKLLFVYNEAGGRIVKANLDGSNADLQFINNARVDSLAGIAVLPAVPEPSSAALALTAITALLALRLRRSGCSARTFPTTSGRSRHNQE
jgi:hypothetical protein